MYKKDVVGWCSMSCQFLRLCWCRRAGKHHCEAPGIWWMVLPKWEITCVYLWWLDPAGELSRPRWKHVPAPVGCDINEGFAGKWLSKKGLALRLLQEGLVHPTMSVLPLLQNMLPLDVNDEGHQTAWSPPPHTPWKRVWARWSDLALFAGSRGLTEVLQLRLQLPLSKGLTSEAWDIEGSGR